MTINAFRKLNIFKLLALKNTLKRITDLQVKLVVLPSGLYTESGDYLPKSKLLTSEMLKAGIIEPGEEITPNVDIKMHLNEIIGLFYDKTFSIESFFNFHHDRRQPFSLPDREGIYIDDLYDDISSLTYKKENHSFVNYLSLYLLVLIQQSISMEKRLLGGQWGRAVSSNYQGTEEKPGFMDLYRRKYEILQQVRMSVDQFPSMTDSLLYDYMPQRFRRYLPAQAIYLEFRILQVLYKLNLQQLTLESNNISASKQKMYNEKIALLKEISKKYFMSGQSAD